MTQLEPVEKKEIKTIVDYIKLDSIVESVEKNLGSRGQQFLTSILSFANSNQAIMECEPRSVYTACLTAATLDLPINQNLGFAYIVPYNNKKTRRKEAQFQVGYKGFVQLAIRTGKYLRLGANAVYEGQLTGLDDFTGEPTFNFNNKTSDKIVGYMAYFELLNGFRKASYMDLVQVEAHAKKYSQSYKGGFGVWKDDFQGMAKKTVLKLLLSKFAPLSTQMEEALINDQKAAEEYIDNKITFEVEDATIEGEAIEAQAPENYLDEPEVEENNGVTISIPLVEEQPVDELIQENPIKKIRSELNKNAYVQPATDKQVKMLAVITNKLPDDVKEVEAKARELKYPGRSRKTFTKKEASEHIEYVMGLTE